MTKIYKIFESSLEINFNTKEENLNLYWNSFLKSELGKIYQSIPWDSLVSEFRLKTLKRRRPSLFTAQGKIALMFLKHYTSLSDRELAGRLNSDYQFQFFCGIHIRVDNPLSNFKIISEICTELGNNMNIQGLQKVLAHILIEKTIRSII